MVQNNCGSKKNFFLKKILGPKRFLGQKDFWVKKILVQKKIETLRLFHSFLNPQVFVHNIAFWTLRLALRPLRMYCSLQNTQIIIIQPSKHSIPATDCCCTSYNWSTFAQPQLKLKLTQAVAKVASKIKPKIFRYYQAQPQLNSTST